MVNEYVVTKLLGALVVIGCIAGLVYFRYYDAFIKSLRVKHHSIWVELGSPAFWNTSPANAWRVTRFLKARSYVGLDPEVARLGNIARRLNFWGLVYFAAIVLLAIASSIAIHLTQSG